MDKIMDIESKRLFEAIYREYQVVLRKIAYTNDIPEDSIDDVVQDTFVAFVRYDYSFDLPPIEIKLLLLKIIKSRCMDFHRRKRYRVYVELEEAAADNESNFICRRTENLTDFVVSKEWCQAILEEIDRLPQSWHDIAVLKMIEGRPTKEVCAILNITEKAYYYRVGRIRNYFRALLSNENWP